MMNLFSAADSKALAYAAFTALVALFLLLDLGVFHRRAREVSMREAAAWSAVWVACGLGFAGLVQLAYDAQWLGLGRDTLMYAAGDAVAAGSDLIIRGTVGGAEAARQYLVGYVVEKSLAMDNIFVIALVFSYFAVPAKYQHRVLFWGIIGAVVMRGALIGIGAGLIQQHQWILMVFGGFLVATAAKMALLKANTDPSHALAVRLARRVFRTVDFYDGQRFFTRRTVPPTYSVDASGEFVADSPLPGTLAPRHAITPLFLALLLVEVADLVFAVDSIPAIFAITPDPFIVYTSNVFAILGLRSLYFCLAVLLQRFRLLKPALILILAFVGAKLLLLSVPPHLHWIGLDALPPVKVGTATSLLVIVGSLGAAVVGSLLWPSGGTPMPRRPDDS